MLRAHNLTSKLSHFTSPSSNFQPIISIMSNNKAELVIVPTPGFGHLVSTVEVAKRMVHGEDRLSMTVLIMKLPLDGRIDEYVDSLSSSSNTSRIKFVLLPQDNIFTDTSNPSFMRLFMESHIPHVRDAVKKLVDSNSPRVAGLLLDMFCTSMIDVANEFGLPSYIFFTSGAAFLGFMFYVEKLVDEEGKDITKLKDNPDAELEFMCFVNPLPAKFLPSAVLTKESISIFMVHARRFKETKGIVVNTFTELESHAIKTLMDDARYPPLYPVGPIINLKNDSKPSTHDNEGKIMEWLNGQPDSSVVFLCFGSMGSFREEQVREIAYALEQSGSRFLWSLRKSPPQGTKWTFPTDYVDFQEVLPEGFLESTSGRGMVIGWAPQVAILAHRAVGGFVSHCGWNSTLESLWFGVPIATWPLYAEQQLNAFLLVMEMGLGVEIKMDYRRDFRMQTEQLVKAEQIERGIRSLMEESQIRERAKRMSQKSRTAVSEGGSSYLNLGLFIDDVFNNISLSSSII